MKKSIHVQEHTPVYNLEEYQQRQRQQRIHLFIRQTLYTTAYLGCMAFTFSMFLWGVQPWIIKFTTNSIT